MASTELTDRANMKKLAAEKEASRARMKDKARAYEDIAAGGEDVARGAIRQQAAAGLAAAISAGGGGGMGGGMLAGARQTALSAGMQEATAVQAAREKAGQVGLETEQLIAELGSKEADDQQKRVDYEAQIQAIFAANKGNFWDDNDNAADAIVRLANNEEDPAIESELRARAERVRSNEEDF